MYFYNEYGLKYIELKNKYSFIIGRSLFFGIKKVHSLYYIKFFIQFIFNCFALIIFALYINKISLSFGIFKFTTIKSIVSCVSNFVMSS